MSSWEELPKPLILILLRFSKLRRAPWNRFLNSSIILHTGEFPFRYRHQGNVTTGLAGQGDRCLRSNMRRIHVLVLLAGALALSDNAVAAPKVHVITFGKWMSVPWYPGTGAENEKAINLKVRALVVDGRAKEFVTGALHDITDRTFAVRRVFRVNDSLPDDPALRWQWQRGGWLLVDRISGHVSSVSLAEFDVLYSPSAWYRDYVAYCGVSDDGKKISAFVVQLSRRKPVLKKVLSSDGIFDDAGADSACLAPVWQRNPARVAFAVLGAEKQTFAIRGHVVDIVNDAEDEEEGSR